MRLIFLAFTLLSKTFADVEVLSINLKGWENCSNDQKVKISTSWENGVKLAAALDGNINFNEAAAVEYLGPPVFTDKYQEGIRNVFKNAATFGQGSRWTPTPLKWDAYVRCDDWKGKCRRDPNIKAYTRNHMTDPKGKTPENDWEREHSTPVINFCPTYFRLPSFAERVETTKNLPITEKYNLDYYVFNRDSALLHELMHADVVTYTRNGNRHIADMMYRLKDDRKWKKAYLPSNVKLFTRVEEVYGGGWVTQNADSWTLYALAKAAQKALGNKYPYLPLPASGEFDEHNRKFPPHEAKVEDGRLSWVAGSDGLFLDEGFTTETCSPEEEGAECPPIIEVSKVLQASMYPKEYLEERQKWLKEIADAIFNKVPEISTTDSPVPGNPSQKCNFDHFIKALPVVPIDTDIAKAKIGEACKLFNDIALDGDKDVQMHYDAVGVEIFPYAAWNAGDPQCIARGSGKVTEQHCVEMFNKLINDCPSDNPVETYGGSKVDNCIVYGFDTRRIFTIGVGRQI